MDERPTAQVYTSSGEAAGELALDPAVFGVEPNVAVMHQVVTAQRAAARSGSASTKTRADLNYQVAFPGSYCIHHPLNVPVRNDEYLPERFPGLETVSID